MRKMFGLTAGAASLALAAGLSFHPRGQAQDPVAEPEARAMQVPQVPDFVTPIEGISSHQLLLSIAGPASGPELLQGRGSLPVGWKADPPLDLSGAMPADDQVRAAIRRGVDFLLEQQAENGSWDVELTGTLLSDTADDAVDAIASTALCGIALRYHAKVDPERIEPVLRKAANFIIDRVYRGKLPLKVWYAIWRYALGMKFLHMEFKATQDVEYKEEIKAINRRMVQSLLRLQLSNSNATATLEARRKTKISSRAAKNAMPTQLGVVLDLPTDQAYRGGAPIARVLEGSSAHKAGLQPGDKIISAEGVKIENAVDFYTLESEWLGGQKILVGIKREGAKDVTREIFLDQTWPGYVGLYMNTGIGTGPVVESFLRFSPAKDALEIGDVITKIDRTEVKGLEDFEAVNNKIKPGDKVKFEVLRGGKKKSASVTAVAAPEGWHGYIAESEDKGNEDGVAIAGEPRPGSAAEKLGLAAGDRVTWVGDTPIFGYDHWVDMLGNVPAGRRSVIKWLRNGEEMSGEAVADALVTRGDPQFDFQWSSWFDPPKIVKVKAGGVSERAGIMNNDVITAIDDQAVQYLIEAALIFQQITAGDEVKLKIKRGSTEKEVKFTLAKLPDTPEEEVEEGGWAYYPEQGESPSFCTAFALLVLQDVLTDIVPEYFKRMARPIKAAQKLLKTLRTKDPLAGGQECYVYAASSYTMAQPPYNDKGAVNMRGTQGRNTICELALTVTSKGGRSKTDVKKACDLFVEYRGELDAVRRMEYYATPGAARPTTLTGSITRPTTGTSATTTRWSPPSWSAARRRRRSTKSASKP